MRRGRYHTANATSSIRTAREEVSRQTAGCKHKKHFRTLPEYRSSTQAIAKAPVSSEGYSMKMLCILVLLSCSAGGAGQGPVASRTVSVSSFDHIRVQGPFLVRVTIGPPRAKITGPLADDGIVVRVDGMTLSVRKDAGGWGERARENSSSPSVVTLSTPGLISASVAAGGQLTIERMRGMRTDVTVSGSGSLTLVAAETDQLNAIMIGTGRMSLAGKAGRARLVASGAGTIDASALDVKDLAVHLDGVGEVRGAARYTAQVTNSGLGTVTIVGNAKCRVDAVAGGPVTCGKSEAVAGP